MKKTYILALLSLFFWSSCTNPADELKQKIEDLYQGELTPKAYEEIADAQSDYLKLNLSDSLSKEYKNALVDNYLLGGAYEKCIDHAERMLEEDSTEIMRIGVPLAEAYKNMKRNVKSIETYKKIAMKRALTSTELSSLGNLELDYYEERPDSTRVENLFNGANAMVQVGNHTEAIKRFDQLVSKHPGSSYGPFALMQVATIYDESLKDAETAKSKYKELIQRYPDSRFAQDAKVILENDYVGKSNEELIEMFMKKQK